MPNSLEQHACTGWRKTAMAKRPQSDRACRDAKFPKFGAGESEDEPNIADRTIDSSDRPPLFRSSNYASP